VHYQNPRVVTGCLVEWRDLILLCRRAIEPRRGLWTLPAGFMENGETLEEGASRETWEEARARVDILGPYSIISLPHVNQVYLIFRARLRDGRFGAGEESLETALFAEAEIPWDEIAFPTIERTLRRYFRERRAARDFTVETDVIRRPPRSAA
jgi:ADP-ribose pyrophosphatase YjhB (NUDIX family)